MKCRNAKGDVKTGGSSSSRDQSGSCPEDCPSDIRHVGGAKPDQALVWNVRTCRPDAKGDVRAARTARIRVPMGGTGAEQLVVSGVSTIETDLRFSGREDFWIIVAARSEDETEIRAGTAAGGRRDKGHSRRDPST